MKRLFVLWLTLFSISFCLAQQRVARVTLKTGVTITGMITEFNPLSHIVIRVGGVDSRIDMGDVASVDEVSSEGISNIQATDVNNQRIPAIIEQENYPDNYVLNIGPYEIEFVLVKGALFNMGYDGRGSMKKHSEPVHSVQLSSFYVNKEALSRDLVYYLNRGVEKKSSSKRYSPGSSKDAYELVKTLANKTDLPFTLISEAQCEYVLTSGIIDKCVLEKPEIIWCCDYFDDYVKSSKPQIDPTGPREGRYRVAREFSATDSDIYTRYKPNDYFKSNAIRISIPASALVPLE